MLQQVPCLRTGLARNRRRSCAAAASDVQCIRRQVLMHPMNIELRSLRHVAVLAELLSYTRAAQKLCLTQSALTRSIQAIEKRAQARLFDRDRGGVRLTPVGRAFVQRAIQLLRDADELERMLQQSA